jgi:hypothetical protein
MSTARVLTIRYQYFDPGREAEPLERDWELGVCKTGVTNLPRTGCRAKPLLSTAPLWGSILKAAEYLPFGIVCASQPDLTHVNDDNQSKRG